MREPNAMPRLRKPRAPHSPTTGEGTFTTPIAKNPVGALVKLRIDNGNPIPIPCVLMTDSGRRYDVIGCRGRTLHCIVGKTGDFLDLDPENDGPLIHWTWTAKRKRIEP